ncbi:MAG: HDIG domain-containing protein [Peptococcaceae bacterium]|nr:HDIG domain-containing protein [Peptococcaceae bacterium]MDH7524739.1 HDIG domain-containing protein [Peptococcaceae bacterium]
MKREEALALLKKNIHNGNLLKHIYAVEAVMGALARHFHEDEETWKLAGLLHDIDYEITKDDPPRHSLVGGEMLEKEDVPPEVVYAVKCHNHVHGLERKSLMDKALFATDPVTGLIVAGALIRPDKKLAPVDVPFLLNRFHEKSFARGASRDRIAACSELGLSLEEFIGIALEAMKGISKELGL